MPDPVCVFDNIFLFFKMLVSGFENSLTSSLCLFNLRLTFPISFLPKSNVFLSKFWQPSQILCRQSSVKRGTMLGLSLGGIFCKGVKVVSVSQGSYSIWHYFGHYCLKVRSSALLSYFQIFSQPLAIFRPQGDQTWTFINASPSYQLKDLCNFWSLYSWISLNRHQKLHNIWLKLDKYS